MKEGGFRHEPSWKKELTLHYELAQTRARQEVWKPRYQQFLSHWTMLSSGGDDLPFTTYAPEYSGPRYPWMSAKNVGDYVLYRFDLMERQGGSELEKGLHQQAAAAGGRLHEGGRYVVDTRLDVVSMEISTWGQDARQEFGQIRQGYSLPEPPGPFDIVAGFSLASDAGQEPAPDLSPSQRAVVSALRRRVKRYDDPQWQRWMGKAREEWRTDP